MTSADPADSILFPIQIIVSPVWGGGPRRIKLRRMISAPKVNGGLRDERSNIGDLLNHDFHNFISSVYHRNGGFFYLFLLLKKKSINFHCIRLGKGKFDLARATSPN